MREEDLEALRRGYEALNRGAVESVLELLDPDIEWQPGQDDPQSGVFRGRAGFESTVHRWTIRDGVAVAWSAHRSRAEALAAIGESR